MRKGSRARARRQTMKNCRARKFSHVSDNGKSAENQQFTHDRGRLSRSLFAASACRFVLRIGGGLVAGLVRLNRCLGFFRTLLGRGGHLLCSLLGGNGHVVRDLLGRHRHLLRAFLGRVRHGLGVALDRFSGRLGIRGPLGGGVRGWLVRRLRGRYQQASATGGGAECDARDERAKMTSHGFPFLLQSNTLPYCLRSSTFCTLPVPPSGSASRKITCSGTHRRATCPARNSMISSRSSAWPCLRTTNSSGLSCHFGCFTPMTAAAATAGWPMAAFSRSIELIHSPPVLMRSLTRSRICMTPRASMVAMFPVGNQPSTSAEAPLL